MSQYLFYFKIQFLAHIKHYTMLQISFLLWLKAHYFFRTEVP